MATNWWDLKTNQQSTIVPGASNPIVFDGTVSNTSIQITQSMEVTSITVQNGYTGTMTFQGTEITTSANDSVKSGCILTLAGTTAGQLIGLSNGADFTVASGATLNLTDGPTAKNAGIAFLFSADLNPTSEYLSNAGTLNWNGLAVSAGDNQIWDSIAVAVLNTGTFNANGGVGGNTTLLGGVLEIEGTNAQTNNVSFYQTSGALNLTNKATVRCDVNYYQSGGQITSDATPCTLIGGGNEAGDINIAGGKVVVDTASGNVGTLTFTSKTVEFNGELDVNGLTKNGGGSTSCDQLICTGAVTLQSNSYLNVATTGSYGLGTGNRWYVMTYASISGSWGNQPLVPPGMSVSTGPQNVLVSN